MWLVIATSRLLSYAPFYSIMEYEISLNHHKTNLKYIDHSLLNTLNYKRITYWINFLAGNCLQGALHKFI